ncbi:MAG: CvpA family protein, partial [Acutalibacteraceae bacterium]
MKNKFLKGFLKILLCAVVIFIAYWFVLPPLNIQSSEMWVFLIFCIIFCVVVNAFSQIISLFGTKSSYERRATLKNVGKPIKFAACAIACILVFSAVASLVGAQIFNASRYVKLITPQDGDFTTDVAEINRTQIPVVDRDTASRLGQRKLGEISDLVSQFVIEDDYTQINYNGKPVRVTPLAYGDIIKWFNNNS